MPQTTRPPLSRRLQARFFRVVNVPMRVILGLPVATPLGRNLMLAFVIGRKTGTTYRQPVSYVRDGDALLTPGGGKWKLNLVAGTPVRLRLRGRDISATPELVSDVDEVGRLLRTMAAGNPAAARFVGIKRDPDGGFDRGGVERAVQFGFRIVRWHPVESAG
jgi:deazaflavin-dependent oxidoreductase (nitroreductase family)